MKKCSLDFLRAFFLYKNELFCDVLFLWKNTKEDDKEYITAFQFVTWFFATNKFKATMVFYYYLIIRLSLYILVLLTMGSYVNILFFAILLWLTHVVTVSWIQRWALHKLENDKLQGALILLFSLIVEYYLCRSLFDGQKDAKYHLVYVFVSFLVFFICYIKEILFLKQD